MASSPACGASRSYSHPGNGALASLDAAYAFFAVGMTPVPELVPPVTAQLEAVKETLAPWAARQRYLNFTETRGHAASFWTEAACRRLRQVKTAIDPGDMIMSNHPISPAR
jgi:hypothetical protein